MALNKTTFKTRATSAIIFVAIMLCGLFVHQWSFYFLFLIIHCGAWIEFQRLMGKININYLFSNRILRLMPVVFGCGFLFYCIQPTSSFFAESFSIKYFGIGIMLSSLLVWIFYFLKQKNHKAVVAKYSVLGLLYLSLPFALLFHIRSSFPSDNHFFEVDFGLKIVLALLVSIWINDTMQYIVGSLVGKTPFSKISPNKTWEGTLGGILLCIITVSVVGYFTQFLPLFLLIAISSVAAIFGTAGDLIESKLKRMAAVKDSGNILPGHGGFLDRFDSFIFAVPFVWLAVFVWLQIH